MNYRGFSAISRKLRADKGMTEESDGKGTAQVGSEKQPVFPAHHGTRETQGMRKAGNHLI
jgi:hypothetical protein